MRPAGPIRYSSSGALFSFLAVFDPISTRVVADAVSTEALLCKKMFS